MCVVANQSGRAKRYHHPNVTVAIVVTSFICRLAAFTNAVDLSVSVQLLNQAQRTSSEAHDVSLSSEGMGVIRRSRIDEDGTSRLAKSKELCLAVKSDNKTA